MAHSFQAAVTARLAESLRHGNGSAAAALVAAMTSADARIMMVVRVGWGGERARVGAGGWSEEKGYCARHVVHRYDVGLPAS